MEPHCIHDRSGFAPGVLTSIVQVNNIKLVFEYLPSANGSGLDYVLFIHFLFDRVVERIK